MILYFVDLDDIRGRCHVQQIENRAKNWSLWHPTSQFLRSYTWLSTLNMVFTGNGVWVRDVTRVAWQRALHLGDIMKSTHVRGTWEETRKQRAGERKENLQRSLINFHFHPRASHQSVKTVTANVPQIRKVTVKFRQPRACRIYLFIKSLLQQLSTASKQCFLPLICFLTTGHRTSMCPLR